MARHSWDIWSEGDLDVTSCSGVPIRATRKVEAHQSGQLQSVEGIVFLCGARGDLQPIRQSTKSWVRKAFRGTAKIVALDSGSFILASAGLLADKKCTLHWEGIPHFTEEFGIDIGAVTNIYIDLGRIATCAGGAAAADLAVSIVEEHHGAEVANRVAEIAIMDRVRGPADLQRVPFQRRFGLVNKHLLQAVRLMMDSRDRGIAIDDIASAIMLSRRQLERLFRAEFNMTPSRYHLLMRLERAHLLLCDTRLSVVQVATACGFVSASHFAKSYREKYGSNPQATRVSARRTLGVGNHGAPGQAPRR